MPFYCLPFPSQCAKGEAEFYCVELMYPYSGRGRRQEICRLQIREVRKELTK